MAAASRKSVFYVDESGQFVRTEDGLPLGLRTLGGVLLDGTVPKHDQWLDGEIRAARDWYRGTIHAAGIKEYSVARALRQLSKDSAPIHLLEEWRALQHWSPGGMLPDELLPALGLESKRLLRRMRLVVGRACRQLQGSVFVCLEYNTDPVGSRYPEMLKALCEELAISRAPKFPVEEEIQVIVEKGGVPADMEAELKRQIERTGLALDFKPKPGSANRGLVLADLVVHLLGPRHQQFAPEPAVAQKLRSPLRAFADRARAHFSGDGGPPVPLRFIDGLAMPAIWREFREKGSEDLESIRRKLAELRKAVPRGCVPAALESAEEALSNMERL